MTDYSELKAISESLIADDRSSGLKTSALFDKFDAMATPDLVLELIAENERYLKLVERMADQYVPLTELEGVPGWSRVVELVEVVAERDKLKIEVEVMRNLARELRGSAECTNVDHCKSEQHDTNEPCKVLARIDAAMSKKE